MVCETYHSPIEQPVNGAIYLAMSAYLFSYNGEYPRSSKTPRGGLRHHVVNLTLLRYYTYCKGAKRLDVLASVLNKRWRMLSIRTGLRRGCGNDDAVLHGIVLLKRLHKLRNGRSLLADGDVDAVKLKTLVGAFVPSLLIQHGVESDGSLASLTIADDKLTLSTANRHHGVDGLETGLHWLVDRAARQDTWSLHLGTALLGGLDWALSVDWISKSVDDTTEHSFADWNIDLSCVLDMFRHVFGVGETHNLSSTLDGLAFLDQSIGTEQHNTDLTGFEVHAHALDARCEPSNALVLKSYPMFMQASYSTSSSACTLFMPCTRAIPSLSDSLASQCVIFVL